MTLRLDAALKRSTSRVLSSYSSSSSSSSLSNDSVTPSYTSSTPSTPTSSCSSSSYDIDDTSSVDSSTSINSYNYAELLKTPYHFFSPATGRMNSNNNLNNYKTNNNNNSNKSNNFKYIRDSDEEEEDDEEDEEQADIDLSILNSNFNHVINSSNGRNNNKFSINNKIKKTGGKNGSVFFVNNNDNNYAIKQQIISTPRNILSQSYREKVILEHLKTLIESNKTCNFTLLINWYKAKPLSSSNSSSNNSNNNNISNNNNSSNEISIYQPPQQQQSQYMHFILEYADLKTFKEFSNNYRFTVEQIKSFLFQVIYALAVAQKEFEFQHNDLHFGNILLKSFPSDKKYIVYQDKLIGKGCYKNWIIGGDWIVKLSDFGLSRMKIPSTNEIIYNKKNKSLKEFYYYSDLSNLKSLINKKIKFKESLKQKDKTLFNCLKNQMDIQPPYKLLEHQFFDSLKVCPSDCLPNNSIRISSDGIIPSEFPTPTISTTTTTTTSTTATVTTPPLTIEIEDNGEEDSNSKVLTVIDNNEDDDEYDEDDGYLDDLNTVIYLPPVKTPQAAKKDVFKTPISIDKTPITPLSFNYRYKTPIKKTPQKSLFKTPISINKSTPIKTPQIDNFKLPFNINKSTTPSIAPPKISNSINTNNNNNVKTPLKLRSPQRHQHILFQKRAISTPIAYPKSSRVFTKKSKLAPLSHQSPNNNKNKTINDTNNSNNNNKENNVNFSNNNINITNNKNNNNNNNNIYKNNYTINNIHNDYDDDFDYYNIELNLEKEKEKDDEEAKQIPLSKIFRDLTAKNKTATTITITEEPTISKTKELSNNEDNTMPIESTNITEEDTTTTNNNTITKLKKPRKKKIDLENEKFLRKQFPNGIHNCRIKTTLN